MTTISFAFAPSISAVRVTLRARLDIESLLVGRKRSTFVVRHSAQVSLLLRCATEQSCARCGLRRCRHGAGVRELSPGGAPR
eukprot:scaffold3731_cov381-Prasinococcus_capsulatus_cf.AAC.9